MAQLECLQATLQVTIVQGVRLLRIVLPPPRMFTSRSNTRVPKFNAKNERVKHRYLTFLTEARQLSVATVDQIATAIADFEQSTGCRDFRLQSYKHRLAKATNLVTKRRLCWKQMPLLPVAPRMWFSPARRVPVSEMENTLFGSKPP